MRLPILGVSFCFLWVCICSKEVPRANLHPTAPKTHFESRNNFEVPQKIVKNAEVKSSKVVETFRSRVENQEDELRKYASHDAARRKASNLRHDDPVVSNLNFLSSCNTT